MALRRLRSRRRSCRLHADADRTAKLNDIDPQAWLADVLARIADMPQTRLARTAALELDDRATAIIASAA